MTSITSDTQTMSVYQYLAKTAVTPAFLDEGRMAPPARNELITKNMIRYDRSQVKSVALRTARRVLENIRMSQGQYNVYTRRKMSLEPA